MTGHRDTALDRIAREVCEAIGSTNGHGTVYAALREVNGYDREVQRKFEFARSAVLYGVTSRGFDGPDGVTKDEALELAAEFFKAVEVKA
jgi:hypothetical protein